MKVKKTGAIVMFAIAVVCALIGVALMLVNQSPVVVEKEITIVPSGTRYEWRGLLRNTSIRPITITKLRITLTTDDAEYAVSGPLVVDLIGESEMAYADPVDLDPDEGLELDGAKDSYGNRVPVAVEKIEIEINAGGKVKAYTLSKSSGNMKSWSFLLIVLAAVFVFAGAGQITSQKRQVKQWEVGQAYAATLDGGTFVYGYIGSKGMDKKAALKTLGSALGAAASALLVGAGSYRIYGGNARKALLFTTDGLYVGDVQAKSYSIDRMELIPNGGLLDAVVEKKAGNVVLTDNNKTSIIVNIKENDVDENRIYELLQKLASSEQADQAAQDFVSAEPQTDAVWTTANKSEYEVVLTDAGSNKIEVVKLVRKLTGMDLTQCADVISELPYTLWDNVDRETAERTAERFAEVGAQVEIR